MSSISYFFSTRGVKILFKGLLLAHAAVFVLNGNAIAENKDKNPKHKTKQSASAHKKNPKAPDPKVIFGGQKAFTESELLKFIDDYTKARKMDNQEAGRYLAGQGWTEKRFIYMVAKVGLTREVVRRGGSKEVINQLPKEARPQKGELELVRKYKAKIDAMPKGNGKK